MPERLHRRLGGHVRRHSLAYAVLALVVSISPAPSMAAELVNTADIANGAVTQPKLAADSVVSGKIANDTVTGTDIKDGTITDDDIDGLDWHNFNLLNEWQNENGDLRPPAWAIDHQGVIHLRGAISGGDTTSFARLPIPVRPTTSLYVSTTLGDNRAPGRIVISPNGYLQADYYDSFDDAINLTSLDGVSWSN